MPALTAEQKVQVYEDRANHMSLVDIAKKYGTTKKTIQRATQSFVWEPKRKMSDDQALEALQALQRGESKLELQARYGVAEATLNRALREVKAIMESFAYDDPETSHRWRGALCLEEEASLFEYDPKEWPNKKKADWKLDIEYAMDACIECPLMVQCGAQANFLDREWTVRGGLPPQRYARDFNL